MKKLTLLIALIFTFGILATAQSQKQIAVHVPFDFYAQNQKMTAGEYIIENLTPSTVQSTLVFRQKDGKTKKILMTIPVELDTMRKSLESTVIFNRYGNKYFLALIRNTYGNLGFEIQKTKQEKSLARNFGNPVQEFVAMDSIKK